MELTATKLKETEVGLIPEDWDLVSLGKVFTFHSTSNYSKAQMSDDDEVGCIHYGLIHAIPNTQYNLKNGTKYYVSSDQAKYDIIRDGDVIMVDASEDEEGVNKSVEVYGVGNKKYISGLHTYLLRDKNGSLADNFRGILLNSQLVKKQMLQLAVGMKVFGVSKTQLIKVKLPLPPTLTEQKAIAQVLSDTDSLIQALEKKIAKKILIKKGIMQKLLTPKEYWKVKSFGEVCDIQKGQLITSDTKIDGAIPVIAGGKEPAYFHNKPNRIGKTITISGSGANAGYVSFHNYEIFASDCSTISESKSYSIEYIYFVLLRMQDAIYKMQTGGAQPHIHPSDINPIELPFPSLQEQKQIAIILVDIDTEISQLIQKLTKYQLAKQGMMQQLLTGKIRLV